MKQLNEDLKWNFPAVIFLRDFMVIAVLASLL